MKQRYCRGYLSYTDPVLKVIVGNMTALDKFKVEKLDGAALEPECRAQIPKQFSAFIHLWRILATAAVFIGHATKPDILFDIDVAIIGPT